MLPVRSESSMPPYGLTLIIGTFISPSEVVTVGCIAPGSKRY
jgi:hypothetical protein